MKSDPATTVDAKDKGDDTLRRFRYQITYAAIISLSLLDAKAGVEEVFCEHHEDILVKLKKGKYVAVQVKTKDLKLGSFETCDNPILHSIKRFIQLEQKFPDLFLRFTIVSNTGFYAIDNGYKNLGRIVELAKVNNTGELLKNKSKTKQIISKLANENGCLSDLVVKVLGKIELRGDVVDLNHVSHDLQSRLNLLPNLNGQTTGVLSQIADNLVSLHFKASSLENKPNLTETYLLNADIDEEKSKRIIDGKRICKGNIEKIISDSLEEPVTLLTQNTQSFKELSKGDSRLVKKMDRGNISFDNVNLQKDNKYAAEKHFISWLHKYGEQKASKQVEQVRLVVQNECQSAYDEKYNEDQPFGTEMLKDVRKRLKDRLTSDNVCFDCKNEHLLGMTGILTEDCKVWWSKKFNVEE